MKTLGESSGRP